MKYLWALLVGPMMLGITLLFSNKAEPEPIPDPIQSSTVVEFVSGDEPEPEPSESPSPSPTPKPTAAIPPSEPYVISTENGGAGGNTGGYIPLKPTGSSNG